MQCYWFLFLQSQFIYWFYKFTKKEFRGASKNTFSFEKMSVSDISQVIDESRIILDIQHPKQSGLTMRTIEMIGMNKKLITTNQNIKKYDFYDPKNVAVVDRKKINISEDFLNATYAPIPKKIYEKYSVESWLIEILS